MRAARGRFKVQHLAVHLKRYHVRIKLPVAIFLWAVEAEAPAHRVAPVVGCAGEEFVPGDRLHLRELEPKHDIV
jgi:hypothetical protein